MSKSKWRTHKKRTPSLEKKPAVDSVIFKKTVPIMMAWKMKELNQHEVRQNCRQDFK